MTLCVMGQAHILLGYMVLQAQQSCILLDNVDDSYTIHRILQVRNYLRVYLLLGLQLQFSVSFCFSSLRQAH
jgi:hypothetical protein